MQYVDILIFVIVFVSSLCLADALSSWKGYTYVVNLIFKVYFWEFL